MLDIDFAISEQLTTPKNKFNPLVYIDYSI